MKDKKHIYLLRDTYKKQLLFAIDEKIGAVQPDPGVDLIILSLTDRLETLEWVLGERDDQPGIWWSCGPLN